MGNCLCKGQWGRPKDSVIRLAEICGFEYDGSFIRVYEDKIVLEVENHEKNSNEDIIIEFSELLSSEEAVFYALLHEDYYDKSLVQAVLRLSRKCVYHYCMKVAAMRWNREGNGYPRTDELSTVASCLKTVTWNREGGEWTGDECLVISEIPCTMERKLDETTESTSSGTVFDAHMRKLICSNNPAAFFDPGDIVNLTKKMWQSNEGWSEEQLNRHISNQKVKEEGNLERKAKLEETIKIIFKVSRRLNAANIVNKEEKIALSAGPYYEPTSSFSSSVAI